MSQKTRVVYRTGDGGIDTVFSESDVMLSDHWLYLPGERRLFPATNVVDVKAGASFALRRLRLPQSVETAPSAADESIPDSVSVSGGETDE